MSIRSIPNPLDVGDESQHLSELMAAIETVGRSTVGRRVVIDRLRVLLAALEQASLEEDAAPIPAASLEIEEAEETCSEYWWGYRGFAAGEALTGWTDTPFARGWLAAAALGSRQCRSDLGIASEPPL